ncbi:Fic family protein [Adlercreutzia sp. ZJ138]
MCGKCEETGGVAWLEINDLHPFREGNGRTQRIFVN